MNKINLNDLDFSVVIPTLGGQYLERTINLINEGTVVPKEILVCIPKDFTYLLANISFSKNVKILVLNVKGQVKQRLEGFKNVSYDYVIQLDDDIYVHKNCFERLLQSILVFNNEVAISPSMIFQNNGLSCYDMVHINSRISTLVHGKNWYEPGKITRTGINIGLNTFKSKNRYNEVDWLPGGCVIHKRENLVLYDFFQFKGKAFYEDVIHSVHLTNKNVKLFIDSDAICGIDNYEFVKKTKWQSIIEFNRDFPYRKHIIKLKGYPTIFLFLDGLRIYIFTFIGILNKSLRNFLFILKIFFDKK